MATKTGTTGNDTLSGGGRDTLIGLAGDDTYFVFDGSDMVVEGRGEGRDTIFVSNGPYLLSDDASVEVLSTATHASVEYANLYGNSQAQTIIGNFGGNALVGRGGGDTLIGLRGDDAYFVEDASDIVLENAGEGDDAIFTRFDYTLRADSSIELLGVQGQVSLFDTGSLPSHIALIGNGFAQTIQGHAGANFISSGGGADTLVGGSGDDVYRVFGGEHQIIEERGGGNDAVYTSAGASLLLGMEIELLSTAVHVETAALTLDGNEFSQTIIGNYGSNIINGGGGSDTLYGLAGDDVFRFWDRPDTLNIDTIVDFGNGADVIMLDAAFIGATTDGRLPASAIAYGPAATDADDRIIYNPQTGALSFDADGNGAGAAVQFAILPTGLAASAIVVGVEGLARIQADVDIVPLGAGPMA